MMSWVRLSARCSMALISCARTGAWAISESRPLSATAPSISIWPIWLNMEKFFAMFSQMGQMLIEGAVALNGLLSDIAQAPVRAQEIKAIEHRADNLTHDIITKLNQTFITPFDREDIHMLSTRL